MINLTKKHKHIIGGIVILIIICFFINEQVIERRKVYVLSEIDENSKKQEEIIIDEENSSPTLSEVIDNNMIVHVEGAVKFPGVYELAGSSRTIDAIEAAGGLLQSADRTRVNLAEKIYDEAFIYIPMYEEEVVVPLHINNRNDNSGLININHATKEELQSLPGIGPALSERIVSYREQHGEFSTLEELKSVSGIGENKYTEVESLITL
ncbi:helix-hairpin-helix domain-containing protein [Serpentinicella sp. ANB-PHB4]|uniref:helix-hairpin-helix domain-containing protein n=1 Tax=Serpentinicella sp. ANB-PHB4 TaxID=3074076 RepID=UPI0028654175|nr:helix-hairpin-helix domain-containing protein [Serpentinicella sp. ANB-PHB4]MDR5658052.1 helix-hairpin-helix domain-containing protein [Serpentinicella sp. ANB-PHB4]